MTTAARAPKMAARSGVTSDAPPVVQPGIPITAMTGSATKLGVGPAELTRMGRDCRAPGAAGVATAAAVHKIGPVAPLMTILTAPAIQGEVVLTGMARLARGGLMHGRKEPAVPLGMSVAQRISVLMA